MQVTDERPVGLLAGKMMKWVSEYKYLGIPVFEGRRRMVPSSRPKMFFFLKKNLEFFLLLNGGLLADGYHLLAHIPPSRLRTTHARSHIYLISYA